MISVVIPVHNTAPYLRKCIDTVLNNTYKDLEIILVENGSTDSSLRICQEYRSLYSNVKLIVSDITGLSHARNVGLDAATGEWIAFVDSDDYVSAEMYQTLLDAAEGNNADLVFCELEMGMEGSYVFPHAKGAPFQIERKQFFYELYLKALQSRSSVNTKLYRKELLKNARFDEDLLYSEDRTQVCRAAAQAEKIVHSTAVLYYYYRGNQTSICKGDIGASRFLDKRMHQLYSLQKDLAYLKEAFQNEPVLCEYVSACLLQNADLRLNKAKEYKRQDQIEIIRPIQKAALQAVQKSTCLRRTDKLRFLWEHYDVRSFRLVYRILKAVGIKKNEKNSHHTHEYGTWRSGNESAWSASEH